MTYILILMNLDLRTSGGHEPPRALILRSTVLDFFRIGRSFGHLSHQTTKMTVVASALVKATEGTYTWSFYYTPESGEHGPRFLTGGPGAAPGGVASKNRWVYHARTGWVQFT